MQMSRLKGSFVEMFRFLSTVLLESRSVCEYYSVFLLSA